MEMGAKMNITPKQLKELGWTRISTGIPIVEVWKNGNWTIMYDASEEESLEMRWRKEGT